MPLYDYDCAACARRFEVIHGVHADPPAACPLCGAGPVKKAITAASVHYKGSGWAKKERRAAVKSGASAKGGDDGSSEGSSDAGPSPSEAGSSPDARSSTSEPGSATTTPGPVKSGDAETPTTKPSKSGASTKTPAQTSD